jgi:gamma-glutamyl-gamma-aminobutyrate hydrolase PuuD
MSQRELEISTQLYDRLNAKAHLLGISVEQLIEQLADRFGKTSWEPEGTVESCATTTNEAVAGSQSDWNPTRL